MIDTPPICEALRWFWDPNPFLAPKSPSKDPVVIVFLFSNLAALSSLHLVSSSLATPTACEYFMSPLVKCEASDLNNGSIKPRMNLLARIESLILYDACRDKRLN